jgi:hypothetical protein
MYNKVKYICIKSILDQLTSHSVISSNTAEATFQIFSNTV